MCLEILVVGRGDHLGVHRSSEVGDLLRALVYQQHDYLHILVVGCHRVGDLLENGCLASARRRDDEAAGALADGRHQIDNTSLDDVRCCLEIEFLDGIDGGEIFKPHNVTILHERCAIDAEYLFELRACASVRCLQLALDQRALANGGTLDGVGCHKNIGRLGLVIVLR